MLAWFTTPFTATDLIASAALVVSVFALFTSWRSQRIDSKAFDRDRAELKVEARLYESGDRPGYIEVRAINVGRRPLFLWSLHGSDAKGNGSGVAFANWNRGHKLDEHEFKVFQITHLKRGEDQFDAVSMGDDDFYEFERMWIVDSVGNRHEMQQVDALLPALREDYREWCERTEYWKPRPSAPDMHRTALQVQHVGLKTDRPAPPPDANCR